LLPDPYSIWRRPYEPGRWCNDRDGETDVSDVFVVEDSMKSAAVTQCVLAQIRAWQFPTIPRGTTSFKTPFVFTPPD
jgi:hypothetical protein